MERESILAGLVLFTLLIGLAVGFWQLYSVERAKKRNSHSALTDPSGPRGPGAADKRR